MPTQNKFIKLDRTKKRVFSVFFAFIGEFMTAAEKKAIYNLVNFSSSYLLGYKDLQFNADGKEPDFQDDVVTIAAKQPEPKKSSATISSIAEKAAVCSKCRLCTGRTHVVPGEGVEHPLVLVVGEGPGEQEDRSGRPFVGPAGQLLDKMLSAINLSRKTNCFIANIVKCRPPHNRIPYPDEMAACSAFLDAQIHILKPKVILAMGSTAIKGLLNTRDGITKLRGQFYTYNSIPLTATYHPSALLHDMNLKRPAWEDLKTLRAWLKQNYPDYENGTS